MSHKIAKVRFSEKVKGLGRGSNRTYYFKTDIEDIKKGDVVLVDSRDSLQAAEFVSYVDPEEFYAKDYDFELSKWVISAPDTTKLDEIRATERRKEEIRDRIENKTSKYRYVEKRRLLAEFDPELKELIKELDELSDQEHINVKNQIEKVNFESVFVL